MKKHISISFIILSLLLFSIQAFSQAKANGLDLKKTVSLLKSDSNIVILDVRTPEEIKETGIIKNAVNIDFKANDFKTKASALDKNKTYVIYCRSGNRAGQAAQVMSDMGFKNISYLKGAGYAELSKELNK
ncbi:rhodanese-like domain-containing protein [Brachyspira innocens]|uniref:rhodanese-like domain-containing protein n=1 Tax=Brachyspira innocens TaxID=13264 RepID=UPI0026ECBED8|nr:rhodanese-like domain-containing protein [Brachyspira innocens]MDO6992546.1 rhodanese-like domain-containing protein [Brachyspira innocens]